MKLFFFVVILALATVSAFDWRADIYEKIFGKPMPAPVIQNCGENEFFDNSTCSGCDSTCCYPHVCLEACFSPRCICKKGFLRDDKHRCIPEKECPKYLRSSELCK
uniref:TIL domain-containing protein n=1 Tax=Steinernema glaseri TaxID=37863 RepID=A0A1I7Y771_9BILA